MVAMGIAVGLGVAAAQVAIATMAGLAALFPVMAQAELVVAAAGGRAIAVLRAAAAAA
jgi:hypothetical protein